MGIRVEAICRSHRGGPPRHERFFTPFTHDLALGEAWEKSGARTDSRNWPKTVNWDGLY
jgi:hypothetical protein